MLLHNWEHWVFVTTLEQFYLLKKHFSLEVTGFARSRSLNVFPVNIMYFFLKHSWGVWRSCSEPFLDVTLEQPSLFQGFILLSEWSDRILQTERLTLFTVGIMHIELSTLHYICYFTSSFLPWTSEVVIIIPILQMEDTVLQWIVY